MFKADDAQNSLEPRRMMSADRNPPVTVTPVDLRQARFGTSVRGFDKAEVMAMLTEAADGYDYALRENEHLRQDITRLEASLSQFRDLETSLKNTLISAQKVADDMRENATQEAAKIVREAEGRAELIVQKAEARREELESDLTTLKSRRRDAEVSVEAIIATLKSTLDEFREQARAEREDRVVPHRPLADVSRAG
jgi:cell division initiation protein